ncbi:hypothetical protein [Bradymonas sediminis]|uniref:Uncharacterized protein n=1 Tax=Bradymonas sediminis TaxID=1548548 RepID=A0A2Z4FJU1_9DELT|nr:hypothetical protein [Bradymonas sediminis]AWV89223.1 hypothetical protein DN745_07660 [Bradymonas sediminis]TDP73390.1 hypothetical protein DFR33_10629 [Bradymonas sediminis]
MTLNKKLSTTDYDDVDDIIGLAEELRMADRERLSAEEMAEVGEDLGIEQKYIEQARTELVRQREAEGRAAAAAAKRARSLRLGVGIGAGALLLIFGIWAASASSTLADHEAALSAQSAQVASARERQKSVHRLFANRPDSPDKDAELVGAENRLRVEIKRCNEALSRYRRVAGAFPASLWADTQRFEDACENRN